MEQITIVKCEEEEESVHIHCEVTKKFCAYELFDKMPKEAKELDYFYCELAENFDVYNVFVGMPEKYAAMKWSDLKDLTRNFKMNLNFELISEDLLISKYMNVEQSDLALYVFKKGLEISICSRNPMTLDSSGAPKIAISSLELDNLKGHGESPTGSCFSSAKCSSKTACEDGIVRVFKLEVVSSKKFKFLRIHWAAGSHTYAVAFVKIMPTYTSINVNATNNQHGNEIDLVDKLQYGKSVLKIKHVVDYYAATTKLHEGILVDYMTTTFEKVEGEKFPGKVVTPFEKTKFVAYTLTAITPCMRLCSFVSKEIKAILNLEEK